jgi:ferredoxin
MDSRSFDVEMNKRLVLSLEDSGVDILHRCGGNARCTTCRVKFIEGEPSSMTAAERERLEERGLLGEARLSCQILADHDMKIEPLLSLSNSHLDDAGPRPADKITPSPLWIEVPRKIIDG